MTYVMKLEIPAKLDADTAAEDSPEETEVADAADHSGAPDTRPSPSTPFPSYRVQASPFCLRSPSPAARIPWPHTAPPPARTFR